MLKNLGRIQELVLEYLFFNGGKNVFIPKDGTFVLERTERPSHVWRAIDSLAARGLIVILPAVEGRTGGIRVSLTDTAYDYLKKLEPKEPKQEPKAVEKKETRQKTLLIGISLDVSASMRLITESAMYAFNEELAMMKAKAKELNIHTLVTVVKCGVGTRGVVDCTENNTPLEKVRSLSTYTATGWFTPLYSSLDRLISELDNYKFCPEKEDVSYLILAVTDGADNNSKITVEELKKIIKKKQDLGNWTFTLRVPDNCAYSISNLGIPEDNILRWETTSKGMAESSVHTNSSIGTFYNNVSSGVRQMSNFYTVNAKDLDLNNVKHDLNDISNDVVFITVQQFLHGTEIRDFMNSTFDGVGGYRRGTAFFELTKNEDVVQPYKHILIQDRTTGRVYHGDYARKMLSLPTNVNIKIRPGDFGQYRIYLQSTSINRKLVGGTTVIFWKDVPNK